MVLYGTTKYEYVYENYGGMDTCLGLYGIMILYRKYRYMVWNPLSRVWFGFGNSQPRFLLGMS